MMGCRFRLRAPSPILGGSSPVSWGADLLETTMASLNSARQFWRSAVRPPLVSRALAPWRRWKRSSEPPPGDGSGGDRGDPPGESSGGSSGEGGWSQDPPLCPQPSPKSPSGDPKLPPPPRCPQSLFCPPTSMSPNPHLSAAHRNLDPTPPNPRPHVPISHPCAPQTFTPLPPNPHPHVPSSPLTSPYS